MTSTSIYQPLKAPTYLYIKQHSITKLKYFGKTALQNPYQYNGSGKYWTDHIKKHGMEHIKTLWVSEPYLDTSIKEIARHFSIENNIIESKEWANLMLENGLDGGDTVSRKIWITDGIVDKYHNIDTMIPSGWIRGRSNCIFNDSNTQSEFGKRPKPEKTLEEKHDIAMRGVQTKKKQGIHMGFAYGNLNPSKRISNRIERKIKALNRPMIICPYCNKEGQQSPGMYRWHFDNCKLRINDEN